MAEDQDLGTSDYSVAGAAEAIEALLKGPGTGEQPEPPPEQQEPQPQATAEAQPASEESASEEAQAPASQVTATPAEQPKTQPASSPELEQKMGDAERAAREATAARDHLLGQLNAVVPQLQAAVAGEFSDIKSLDDLQALADPNSDRYNPDRYNRYVIANARLQQALGQQQRLHAEHIQATTQAELAKVAKALPEFTDPEKGPQLRAKLKAFAKTQNIDVENRQFLASDVLTLHRLMTADAELNTLKNERAAIEAQKAEAQKKAAKAPPVQQPGTQRTNDKGNQVQESYTRLQKTGRLDDAAALIRHLL